MFNLEDEIESAIFEKTKNRMYTDQTGKFMVQSSRGNQYIMVLINMDSSYISMEPMKNQHSGQMVATCQVMIDRLKLCSINPKHYILNNECSNEFKEAIKANDMTYQLVPGDDHQRNIAKQTIQTAKSHVISVLCGCNPNFHLHLWNLLIP